MTSELPVAVIGAGGFGREILDILRDQNREILGVFDDAPSARDLDLLADQAVPYLGTIETLANETDPGSIQYVIGIGSGSVRRRIDEFLTPAGLQPATLAHSSASLGFGVSLSPGVLICAGARLTTNISLGKHTHIHVNATVGHDSILGNFVTALPLSAISGSVAIGEQSLIGASAFVRQGVSVGESSIVGAASAVIRDVPSGATVVGVPARELAG